MLRLLKAAIAVCVVSSLTAATASAAPVNFVGTVSPGNALFAAGTAMSLALDFTPAVGLTALVNTATLTIGTQSWSTLIGGAGDVVSIVTNGVGPDDLAVNLSFGPSAPGGFGTITAALGLTINSGVDLGAAPDASAVNIATLAAFGNPGGGSLVLQGGVPGLVFTNFSGTAVPEPGSIALLSGLGLVFGRGAWRRRKAKQIAA